MKRIKRWLQNWLGLPQLEALVREASSDALVARQRTKDLVQIGVDVHFKGESSMILVYSRLGGGQIREIPARFDNISDLNRAVKEIEGRYGADPRGTIWDAPPAMRSFIER